MTEKKEEKKDEKKPLWSRYRVLWTFPDNLCGSVPRDQDFIDGWLNSRKPTVRPPGGRSIPEIQAEIAETLANQPTAEEELAGSWLTFQTVNGGFVQGSRTVRAHFKDCARVLSSLHIGKVQGEKSFAVKVVNSLYVEEYWIPITREGKPVSEASGYLDRMVHATGPRGPINALKRIDYVTGVQMQFTLKVLSALKQSDLELIMAYGGTHGFAGERSDGEGRYIYQITPLSAESN